ncbi:MAG TPA: radical SAM protein [Polyangia bacterium]|jgi:hypothetical protein
MEGPEGMECACAEQGGRLYLGLTRGMCRECRTTCEARYVADEGGVWLERRCPTHGVGRALVAETLPWYLDAMRQPGAARPPEHPRPRTTACPGSCGPCAFHGQRCQLPVFSITNACDLRCPICFTYNRPDQRWFMSAADFTRHLDYVLAATGGVDLVNLTGGEPTTHPDLLALLALARRPGIGRVTVNSNGLRLAREPDLCRALADLGVYVILSLDTLDPATSVRMHGRDITTEKRRALDNLARAGVSTTLLMVLAADVNEGELGAVVDLAMTTDTVRSLTIQTMTYTGQGGGAFTPRRHIPVEGVERRLEEATAGRLARAAFVPLPTAHPLCYGVAYLLVDGDGGLCSFTDLLGRPALAAHLADGYLLHPTAALESELRDAIDRLWSEGRGPALLAALKDLLRRLYPTGETLTVHERQRRAERAVKTVYVHAHMDEDTWEAGRAMRCPDQVPVDAERLVGACNYNLFYRQSDSRFWVAP